jgi:hypothetical protein
MFEIYNMLVAKTFMDFDLGNQLLTLTALLELVFGHYLGC